MPEKAVRFKRDSIQSLRSWTPTRSARARSSTKLLERLYRAPNIDLMKNRLTRARRRGNRYGALRRNGDGSHDHRRTRNHRIRSGLTAVGNIVGWKFRYRKRRVAVFSAVTTQHRRERGLRGQIVERTRDSPLEQKSDRRDRVARNFERLRVLVVVLGWIAIIGRVLVVLRARHRGRTEQQNCA
jgi:hypothetical protein